MFPLGDSSSKPSGKIIFSFLEFRIASHWDVFESNIASLNQAHHLNQFVSRDRIEAWARHLGLRIDAIYDGDTPHIPLDEPLVLDDGHRFDDLGTLGQSLCILSK